MYSSFQMQASTAILVAFIFIWLSDGGEANANVFGLRLQWNAPSWLVVPQKRDTMRAEEDITRGSGGAIKDSSSGGIIHNRRRRDEQEDTVKDEADDSTTKDETESEAPQRIRFELDESTTKPKRIRNETRRLKKIRKMVTPERVVSTEDAPSFTEVITPFKENTTRSTEIITTEATSTEDIMPEEYSEEVTKVPRETVDDQKFQLVTESYAIYYDKARGRGLEEDEYVSARDTNGAEGLGWLLRGLPPLVAHALHVFGTLVLLRVLQHTTQ